MARDERDIHLVNVFAADGGGGNLAPIVLDARGLTDSDMRDVARRHQRESAFVFPGPEGSDVDWALRFFVPEHEMEMCGHATVGVGWVMRQLGLVGKAGNGEMTFSTMAGVVRTRAIEGADGEASVFVSQPKGAVEAVPGPSVEETLSVLGIEPHQLAQWPVQNACTSRVKTAIPVKDVPTLNSLQPDFSGVKGLCDKLGSTGLYPYAIVARDALGGPGPLEVEARQFPKASGYPEDAATGIAAAALAYALHANGVLRVGEQAVVYQGRSWGYLSQIQVKLEEEGCWVGGKCAWETR